MRAADVGSQQFVRFPPRWRHVLVPVGPPGATALGTTLYTASRPRPLLAQRVLWALARTGGGRLLPGPRETWQPPVDPQTWAGLWADWVALLGGVDAVAVYSRPQASRSGLVLALWQPARAAVVRLRRDSADLDRERRLQAAPPAASFRIPRALGQGRSGDWHWLAAEAMAHRPHRPVTTLPAGLLADVARTVGAALPAPPGMPAHWRPAHGDLTPWNLRRAGRQTWLIDWEDAGWAPPHADAVYFDATAASLTTARPVDVTGDRAEAAAYWRERVALRPRTDTDAGLSRRLAALLSGG